MGQLILIHRAIQAENLLTGVDNGLHFAGCQTLSRNDLNPIPLIGRLQKDAGMMLQGNVAIHHAGNHSIGKKAGNDSGDSCPGPCFGLP